MINLAGIFDVDLSPEGILKGLRTGDPTAVLQPIAGQSSKGGLGTSIGVLFLNNTTTAQIGTGTRIHTDAGTSGLQVNAGQRIFDLSLRSTGASSGGYGFSGTFSVTDVTGKTTVQVASGVTIDGGPIDIEAIDNTVMASFAGDIECGNHLGFGFTAVINDLNRETDAFLGDSPDVTSPASSTLQASRVTVKATNEGALVAISYAAADVGPDNAPKSPTT